MAFSQVRVQQVQGQQLGAQTNAFAADTLGLSFYGEPPADEVSVREFEEVALDRLRLLHAFDRLCGYDSRLGDIPDMRPKVSRDLHETRLELTYPSGVTAVQQFQEQKGLFCRRDVISHFALRLAFCKTRDAREWFLRQEQRLFVLRFDALSPDAQEAFLKSSGLPCKKFQVDDKKDNQVLQKLQQATPAAKNWRDGQAVFDRTFYEMPFFEVHPSLISRRQVVVKGGTAFVPSSALKIILAGKFKERVSASLDVAFNGLPAALSDPRVGGFLRLLQDHGLQLLVAPKSSSNDDVGEKLTLENFEEFLVRSFPPCMRRLVEKQRELKKHLKHAGRLQLRPFLKECGFTIDDSMRWWRQELCRDPEIDVNVYEKNYTYDVEHTYGKKGHFQGQNAFGCPKVIGFPGEAVGQVHGCPFKQLDIPSLRQQLHRWRLPETYVGEIEKFVNGKHFQLGCIEYFKAMHPGHEGDGVGNAPGEFFRESCRCHAAKREKAEKSAGTSSRTG